MAGRIGVELLFEITFGERCADRMPPGSAEIRNPYSITSCCRFGHSPNWRISALISCATVARSAEFRRARADRSFAAAWPKTRTPFRTSFRRRPRQRERPGGSAANQASRSARGSQATDSRARLRASPAAPDRAAGSKIRASYRARAALRRSGSRTCTRLEVERHRNVAMNGRQLLAQQDLLAIVLQAFAIHLPLDFGGVFDARSSTDPKRTIRSFAPFSPMPGAPGMLSTVSPFSASRSATCDGLHAHELLGLRGVVDQIVLHRDSACARDRSPVAACLCRSTR